MFSLICNQIHANLLSSLPTNKIEMHQSNTDTEYPALMSGWGRTQLVGILNSGLSEMLASDVFQNCQCAALGSDPGLECIPGGTSERLAEMSVRAPCHWHTLDLHPWAWRAGEYSILLFHFRCLSALPACMYVHAWYQWKPKEGDGPPGCQLPLRCWEANPSPLQEQQALLTTKSLLQSQIPIYCNEVPKTVAKIHINRDDFLGLLTHEKYRSF